MNDTDTAETFTPSLSRQRSVQTVRHFCFDTGACQVFTRAPNTRQIHLFPCYLQ